MINNASNPWVEKFSPLLDANYIKTQATVNPKPLENLNEINIEHAILKLGNTLQKVFYPTNQIVRILQQLVGIAHAHSAETYLSRKAFIAGIYNEETPLPNSTKPVCLTGPAGIGKTALLEAFSRIIGPETSVQADQYHPAFRIIGPRLLSLKTLNSPLQIAKSLFVGIDVNTTTFTKRCKQIAFRDGISMIIFDESQFTSASSTANSRITQILLSYSYIGVPFLYASNYSLLHRLTNRPEEDRQRLITDLIFLTPDTWSSECWHNTLLAIKSASPDTLKFEPERDAKKLYIWTAGRKRALVDLILIAFRVQHAVKKCVDIAALENAYYSSAFTEYRKDSEIMINNSVANRPNIKRKDLFCPIPIPNNFETKISEVNIASREEEVADKEIRASLNKGERKAIEELDAFMSAKINKTGKPKPLKRIKPSSEAMLENFHKFKESL